MLMLIVMAYNVWLFLAAVLGLGAGFLVTEIFKIKDIRAAPSPMASPFTSPPECHKGGKGGCH